MPSETPAVYRDIPNLNGFYQASADGTVRGCLNSQGQKTNQWHPMRMFETKRSGHLRVNLSRRATHGNRGKFSRFVHQLILETFAGPRPPGMECRHLDGNPKNNHINNLCWGTKKENAADTKRHGRLNIHAAQKAATKLTEEQVREMFRLNSLGFGCRRIGRMTGVPHQTVYKVISNRTWKGLGLTRTVIARHRWQADEAAEAVRLGLETECGPGCDACAAEALDRQGLLEPKGR